MYEKIVLVLMTVTAAIFLGFALIVLKNVWSSGLKGLICEINEDGTTGKASLSRLQLLLFTFVIAGLYMVMCIEAGYFVAIPQEVLGLLGISGGSYLISKGVSGSKRTDKQGG